MPLAGAPLAPMLCYWMWWLMNINILKGFNPWVTSGSWLNGFKVRCPPAWRPSAGIMFLHRPIYICLCFFSLLKLACFCFPIFPVAKRTSTGIQSAILKVRWKAEELVKWSFVTCLSSLSDTYGLWGWCWHTLWQYYCQIMKLYCKLWSEELLKYCKLMFLVEFFDTELFNNNCIAT